MKAHLGAPGFLLAVVAALTPVRGALAQSPSSEHSLTKAEAEAETRFKRGVDLYKEGDFGPALIEFRRAYELAPNYRVLYNIGQVQYQLQDYAAALRALQKYVAEGGNAIAKERRTAIETEIEKLKLRVGSIELKIAAEGAEIAVDDVVFGTTPLSEPLLVSAGRRKITASMGSRTVTKMVDVGGGDVVAVSLELPEAQPSAPKPSAEPLAPPPVPVEPQKASLVWLPWAATGALTVGAVATGVLALGASSDFTQMAPAPNNEQDRKDLQGKALTFAIVTDVLAGTAVVMAGVSIYVTVASGKSSAQNKPATGAPAHLTITASPSRLGLIGTF